MPELTKSPLLLSIVCALFDRDFDIPKGTSELFEQCIDGLVGKWDSFRSIERDTEVVNLDRTERIKILSVLANRTLENNRQIVFSKDDSSVKDSLTYLGQEMGIVMPDENSLLRYFHNDYCLLTELAYGFYSFFHLQFQEYLCAIYIHDSRGEEEFLGRIENNFLVWEYPIRFLAKKLLMPASYLKKLWGMIDKFSFREVNIFIEILKDKPSIGLVAIYEIVDVDLCRLFEVLEQSSKSIEANGDRLVLNGVSENDFKLKKYFGMIALRNQLNKMCKASGAAPRDPWPLTINKILICCGNSNKIYRIRDALYEFESRSSSGGRNF